MSSGGARTRSGPAPDPSALRRDRKSDGEWLLLPSSGRSEKAPEWPFVTQSDREATVWTGLWSKPQAVAWSRFQLEDQVALYVRRWCEAEEPESPTNLSTLVRQMADALGLTVPGMNSLRWKIAADETAEKRASKRAPRSSSRDRLKVVPRDGA